MGLHGGKNKFKEPLQKALLTRQELKLLLDKAIDILQRQDKGIDVSNEYVSETLPARFKIERKEEGFLDKILATDTLIIEAELNTE